jgi:SAM-dependent methyltransferase
MYARKAHSASAADFWEDHWNELPLGDVARTCEHDPLFPLFERVVVPDRLFMDGGCGLGQWVKYFHDRGYKTLGVDFARQTVERLRQFDPSMDVREGDVRSLPISDGALHTYYSGGVVEHFEGGAEEALHEARRVMATDGWFLCSVPDATWLRDRVLFRSATEARTVTLGDLAVRRVSRASKEAAPPGWSFFQYAYSQEEFRGLLARAGFVVEETFCTALLWGLFEIPGLRRLVEGAVDLGRSARRPTVASAPTPSDASRPSRSTSWAGRMRSGVHGLVVREDRGLPIVGSMMHAALERMGNMRMYVARPC